jgi:hypothetical protein
MAIERALAALQEVGDAGFEEAEPTRPPAKKAAKKHRQRNPLPSALSVQKSVSVSLML